MTMPHTHNFPHDPDGWCLKCVGRMHDTCVRLVEKVNELSDQRCKLVLAVLSDCGSVPDVEEFIADQFGGDWNRAVDFAVQCIRTNRDPSRNEAFKPSPRSTAGR